jgi:hypothetical protein
MIQQTKTTERKNTFFSSSSSSLKQISDWLKWEKIARGRKQKKYLILFIFSKKYKSPPMDLVFFFSLFPFVFIPLFSFVLSFRGRKKEKKNCFGATTTTNNSIRFRFQSVPSLRSRLLLPKLSLSVSNNQNIFVSFILKKFLNIFIRLV